MVLKQTKSKEAILLFNLSCVMLIDVAYAFIKFSSFINLLNKL